MKSHFFKSIILLIIFISPLIAQEDVQIGSLKWGQAGVTGLFDYSDPTGINIKVQVWGYVKFPGYYIIPARSNVNDLMSLAGGPAENARLEDIRIVRTGIDSTTIMYKFNYNDLVWEENLKGPVKFSRLLAGDMLIIPGEPRYFVREDITFYLSLITTLASLTALILSILAIN